MDGNSASYPKSSTTDNTASAPTGNAADKTDVETPKAEDVTQMTAVPSANASQVTPHKTSCSGDAVLEQKIANGMKMHDEGGYVEKM